MNYKKLAIVIPCLNEEQLIQTTSDKLLMILDNLIKEEKISPFSFLYFVDDGSTDYTWLEIGKVVAKNPNKIKAIKFSNNFGNQKALLAGMLEANKLEADIVITIDADLQQDENKIKEFIDKYNEGFEIVFGIRNNRKTDGIFKKLSALTFYKLMNIFGVKIQKNHSDYRLVSKNVLNVLEKYPERNLFLRGIFHEIGFKTTTVNFDVKPRTLGKSKYNIFSLFALAIDGITSHSIAPLKLICFIGFLSMLFGFTTGLYALIAKILYNDAPNGWATAIILLSFFGGFQIFCTGIIGEYLAQIYKETKKRPRYIIEDRLD